MSVECVTTLWATLSKVFLCHGTQVFPIQVLKCFAHLRESIQVLCPQQPLLNISTTPLHRIWKIRYKLDSWHIIQCSLNNHLRGFSHITVGLAMFGENFVCFDAWCDCHSRKAKGKSVNGGMSVYPRRCSTRSEMCRDNCQLEEMSVRKYGKHTLIKSRASISEL